MPRRRLSLMALPLVALAAGCGGGSQEGGGGTGAASAPSGRTDADCRKVAQPPPKTGTNLPRPTLRLDPSKTWVATVNTSCGAFAITLAVAQAPRTTGSFASLARRGFYDRTTFHRIVPGFVIQGGDPKGNGTGGPGYSVVEPPPKGERYREGTVAMAKAQFDAPGTSGSQFFVVTGSSVELPPEYALLGKVSGGQPTVNRIASVDANAQSGKPASPVVIDSIRVASR